MREEEVPQDESFYGGHLRACYTVDRNGRYVVATSRGWETERIATARALAELEEGVETARQGVIAGDLSPLAYHMAVAQMTPRLLARNSRIWLWRVRRHLKPGGFGRIRHAALVRYAESLGISIADLRVVPRERTRVFTDSDRGGLAEEERV